jgi:hypothetical protein
MVVVSQRAVFAFIGFLLLMMLALIVFFLHTDFDYLLGRKDLAMKVGQTSISISDLQTIQKISGIRSRQLSESAFAVDFFETVLLAEAGRKAGLDNDPEFVKKTAAFRKALKNGHDNENIARAVFILEELAQGTIRKLVDQYDYERELAQIKIVPVAEQPRLHLRTILVKDPQQAQMVIEERLAGRSFSELNASWSISLYKPVGGDIGWKSAMDFPNDVFTGLSRLEKGILVEAFSDHAGTHLFEIIGQPETNPAAMARAAREQALRELKKRRFQSCLAELMNRTDYWINPVLQTRCQVAGVKLTEKAQ